MSTEKEKVENAENPADVAVAAQAWYALKAQSYREEKIQGDLEKRIRVAGLGSKFGQILIPTERIVEIKGGEREVKVRKIFPGYLFVHMEIDADTTAVVMETNGITGFVGPSPRTPVQLSQQEMDQIFKTMKKEDEGAAPKIQFALGDTVRIKEGPFENFEGTVEEINVPKGTLKVMVVIFGRTTPVELEVWQVEAL